MDDAEHDEVASAKAVTRRDFALTGGVACAVLLGVGGASRIFVGKDPLLRPPGGQNDASFLKACIKCDRCRSACPQQAIDVANIEDGLLNARTPVMNFRKGYCTFCGDADTFRCVEACPTSALLGSFNRKIDAIGIARLNESECLLYRSGSKLCSKKCMDACAYDAIKEEGGRLTVVGSLCNGCGACEWACPSASYGSFTGTNARGIVVAAVEGERA